MSAERTAALEGLTVAPDDAIRRARDMAYAALDRCFVEGNWSAFFHGYRALFEAERPLQPEIAFVMAFGGPTKALAWLAENRERLERVIVGAGTDARASMVRDVDEQPSQVLAPFVEGQAADAPTVACTCEDGAAAAWATCPTHGGGGA